MEKAGGIFLRYLKSRGLTEIKLVISDKSLGLLEALSDFYPGAKWRRCVVHFYGNVFRAAPSGKIKEAALKAIQAQEDRRAARQKAAEVVKKLRDMRLLKAAGIVEAGGDETLSYYDFPSAH